MADVTFTAASIAPGTNAQKKQVEFGATITQGMALYLDASDNLYKIASNAAATTDNVTAMALTSGATGQPGVVITGGNMTCNNLVAGETYVLSTAGKISPITDALASDWMTVIGVATSTTNLLLGFIVSSTQHA